MDVLLQLENLEKSFGPVSVLKGVNLAVEKGEVHALLGANGAGKSTLINIIGGVLTRNGGAMIYKGQQREFGTPVQAQQAGISIIHQELSLIPQLTVLDNFFLGREPVKMGLVNRKEMHAFYNKISKEMNFDIPPGVKVRDLSIAKRQMVEVMKAVSYNADLIVMDEPTSSLSEQEKQTLFSIIRELKKKGKTIIYISHMLEEIFEVCDRVSVLLGGVVVDTSPVEGLTQHRIAELMSGVEISQQQHKRTSAADYTAGPTLEVKGLCHGNHYEDISFQVFPGEVLGIAGLVGAGRSEIVRGIFGADRFDKGEILLAGRPLVLGSPSDAIEAGIGLVPEDRKTQGLILKHPIYQNISILSLDKMKTNGLLSHNKERQNARMAQERLSIKLDSVNNPVSSLSGGNQQKVVVGKWLEMPLKVLIFDEPTKGIDIRAKEDIFSIVEQFAGQGVSVIFISSDLEEVLRVSDRVMVLHDGKIKAIRENKDLDLQGLMDAILVS